MTPGTKPQPGPLQLLLPFEGTPSATPARALTPEDRAAGLFLRAVQERRVQSVQSVRVTFRPFRSTIYSFRIPSGGAAQVSFHCALREAPEEVLVQAAHLMLCRTQGARRKIPRHAYDAFVRSLPPSAFDLPGARRAGSRARTSQGRFHSLDECFERVNAKYFHPPLAKPMLCWSPRRARRVLGTYQERHDRVMVSRVLDSERVPLYVLDYLMYHELLHKHLGTGRGPTGRRCMHGRSFRQKERQFEQYDAAILFLKKL